MHPGVHMQLPKQNRALGVLFTALSQGYGSVNKNGPYRLIYMNAKSPRKWNFLEVLKG